MPEIEQEQQHQSESQDSTQDSQVTEFGEQSLDDHIEAERAEIEELDKVNAEGGEKEDEEEPTTDEVEEETSDEEEPEEEGEYKPNTKFKVNDTELEFDPKLKKLLTKETEPIIRELYEKGHGIEAVKESRDARTKERDEIQGNYNNLVGEVSRVLQYRKAGDLQSFFESVQLDDNTIAKYILEKARIAELPPDQQAVYNEREALRKRMNTLEQNFHAVQTRGTNDQVQERLASLDNILGSVNLKRAVTDFDTRNGAGSFKQAVLEYGASQWQKSQKDLSVAEAIEGFMKTFGIVAPKGQPKPSADATRRVVARPKVKSIPNYGGGQASVTATRKPRSVEDLRKLAKGESL